MKKIGDDGDGDVHHHLQHHEDHAQTGGRAHRVEVLSALVERNEKSEGCHLQYPGLSKKIVTFIIRDQDDLARTPSIVRKKVMKMSHFNQTKLRYWNTAILRD